MKHLIALCWKNLNWGFLSTFLNLIGSDELNAMNQNEGIIVVISGPSGAGKNSIINFVMRKDQKLILGVSHTTRDKLPGEIEGTDYHFIKRKNCLFAIDWPVGRVCSH